MRAGAGGTGLAALGWSRRERRERRGLVQQMTGRGARGGGRQMDGQEVIRATSLSPTPPRPDGDRKRQRCE